MTFQRCVIFFLLFFVIFGIDASLKWYVHTHIPLTSFHSAFPYGGIGVFQGWCGISFSLSHVINTGAAWGKFANTQTALLCLRMVIVGGMMVYLFLNALSLNRFLAFCLIISGALGNIFDTFVYGHVIDMFRFDLGSYTYPVFNVADSCIVLGIAFLCLDSLLKAKKINKRSSLS